MPRRASIRTLTPSKLQRSCRVAVGRAAPTRGETSHMGHRPWPQPSRDVRVSRARHDSLSASPSVCSELSELRGQSSASGTRARAVSIYIRIWVTRPCIFSLSCLYHARAHGARTRTRPIANRLRSRSRRDTARATSASRQTAQAARHTRHRPDRRVAVPVCPPSALPHCHYIATRRPRAHALWPRTHARALPAVSAPTYVPCR